MSENGPLPPELEAVRQAVRALDEAPAEPAFRARLRQRFADGTIARSAPADERRPGWLAWLLAPAMAAATVATLLFVLVVPPAPPPVWQLHAVRGGGELIVDGRPSGADVERLRSSLLPGRTVELAADSQLVLRAGDVAAIELDDSAVVTLPDPLRSGEWTTARLERGELRVRTGPDFTGHRLRIETPEGRAELTGTTIAVFRMEGVTCVCVLEGVARIGVDEASMDDVTPGLRKVMYGDGRPAEIIPIMPEHEAGLEAFVESTRDLFE